MRSNGMRDMGLPQRPRANGQRTGSFMDHPNRPKPGEIWADLAGNHFEIIDVGLKYVHARNVRTKETGLYKFTDLFRPPETLDTSSVEDEFNG
jgi:hypothetical protein